DVVLPGLLDHDLAGVRRHEDAAAAAVLRADGAQGLETVHARQLVVHQDQAGPALLEGLQGVFSTAGELGLPAAAAQVLLQVVPQQVLVFHDENRSPRHIIPWHAWWYASAEHDLCHFSGNAARLLGVFRDWRRLPSRRRAPG